MKSLNTIKLENILYELQLAYATDNMERAQELKAMIELIKADMKLREDMGLIP